MGRWRDDLRTLIVTDPSLKMKIMKQLRVSERSPERWVAGDHKPSYSNVLGLARMFPELDESLRAEFPKAFGVQTQGAPKLLIPENFYDEIITALAHANPRVGKPAMIGTMLTQMIGHLDPEWQGLLIVFAQCLLEDGIVSSLQISPDACVGTGPWSEHVMIDAFRAGTGSLVAAAVSRGRPVYWPMAGELEPAPHVFNSHLTQSAVAFPIIRYGARVAGALFFASTQEDFFTKVRRDLIKKYTDLFALAFGGNEFYRFEQIALEEEPTAEHQKQMHQFFRSFVRHVREEHPDLSRQQAEDLAVTILEEKLKRDEDMRRFIREQE